MYELFVVPPSFRCFCSHRGHNDIACLCVVSRSWMREARALAACNVAGPCTLLTRYRLTRGIIFLRVGALSAAGASSLLTPGKGHVSCSPKVLCILLTLTLPY